MSREIKYRCFDKSVNRMAYGIECEYDSIMGIVYENPREYLPINVEWPEGKGGQGAPCEESFGHYLYSDFDGEVPNDNYVVQQYIGIKDSNGKKVYEGDVVRLELFGGAKVIGVIEYVGVGFVVNAIKHDCKYALGYIQFEVIGHVNDGKLYE